MGNVQSSSGESWFFVTNPPVPFEQQLIGEGGGLQPGKVVYLEGEVQPVEEVIKNRFTINFYEYDNIVFHYDVRQWKEENNIVMNSRHENLWQQERRVPMDIKLDQPFRIDVQIMQTGLVITQDHGNPVSFNFRNGVTSEMISKITIEGNIKLATVYYGDAKNMNGSKMQFDVPPTCQSCNQPAWPSNCPPPHCSPSQPPICQNCHQPAWQPNCPPPNCNPNCPPPIQICPGHPTTVTSPSLPLTPPPCQNCHQPAWQPNCPPPNCSPSCPPPCQSCQQPAWQPNCPPPNCFPNQPPTQPPPNSVPNQPSTPPACQNCHQPAWQPNCPPPNCSPSCPPPCQNCQQPAWQPNCPPPNCFPNQPPTQSPPNCNPNYPPPIQICPGHPTTVTSPNLPLNPPACQNCHQPAWQPNCPPPNCSPSCPPPCQSCQQPAWQPNCPPPNCFPNQPPTQPPPNSVPNLPLTPPACQNCHQPAWQPNCPPPNCSPSCPPPCQNCRQPAWQPNCPPPNCFPNQPQINVGGICGKPAQPGGCNAPQNAAIPLPNGMCTGRKICITGIPNENAGRFDIDIKGNECDGNRLLHLSVRFLGVVRTENNFQCDIVMNSMRSFNWECEQRRSGVDFPFQKCQQFQIEIHCDCAGYKIFINGQCYAEFPHRMDCSLAKSVSIDGDLHSINIQEL